MTVKKWLCQQAPPGADPPEDANGAVPAHVASAEQPEDGPSAARADASRWSGALTPPPAPWQDWDQVRQVREALHEHRFLLLRRPDHLDGDQQAQVAVLLASPAAELTAACTFVRDWYALWKDEQGQRRTAAEARARAMSLAQQSRLPGSTCLATSLACMTDAHFERLSAFLQQPSWEATNNGAERGARAFGIAKPRISTCAARSSLWAIWSYPSASGRQRRSPGGPMGKSFQSWSQANSLGRV